MEDYFLIPKNKIEKHWQPIDLSMEIFALEYCEEVLDIPLVYIEESYYEDSGLIIELKNIKTIEVVEADWYIQLRRLAQYARAS